MGGSHSSIITHQIKPETCCEWPTNYRYRYRLHNARLRDLTPLGFSVQKNLEGGASSESTVQELEQNKPPRRLETLGACSDGWRNGHPRCGGATAVGTLSGINLA